jgi:uncharacterized protein YbaP (TraB family)
VTRLLAVALLGAAVGNLHADPAAWRVTASDGGELTLLGSMHYLKDEDYPLPSSVSRLYERADALVMELDLDDVETQSQQATLVSAAMLPPGTMLRDVLDTELYAHAERSARELGVDLELLARFEPWLVAITLLDHGMGRLGYRAERGIEQYFVELAERNGKEIYGLESLESQIRIFDELPRDSQQALLEQTLDELDLADDAMRELAGAWRDGELEKLTEKLLADFASFPGLYDSLVVDRNRSWIAPLEGYLRERRRYLVVVGALHLVGPDNVVTLLEQRGFTVTRLTPGAD